MDQTRSLESFLAHVQQRDPHQSEFAQAVREVMTTLWPFLEENPRYRQLSLLERLVEPERVIQFRVTWVDDRNQVQVNRAWRVQFNSAIGPFKGGMRFHPSVNLSILKFLGFEQTFKNALTTLPMGGGKGGSDFDPKGKSEGEVMRFCQALMTELWRHLGPDTDVPAGDIGVGAREVGFMAGMMKKLSNNSACVFTGKGLSFGGSLIRPEATGYGLVYFTEAMLKRHGLGFEGMRVAVSGSGNVAQYAIEKAMQFGARVVTASDSRGTVVDEAGFTAEKLARLCEIKASRDGRLADYARIWVDVSGRQAAVGCSGGYCPAVRHAKRTGRGRRAHADRQRREGGGRRGEYADHHRCDGSVPRSGRAVCPARPPMRAAWQPPALRWRKTPRVLAGRRRKWMPVCTISCWIFTTPAWSTAVKRRKLTTCAERISQDSLRWRMR